jgi:hypothetical protein
LIFVKWQSSRKGVTMMTDDTEAWTPENNIGPRNPEYPKKLGATVSKYRAMARDGLQSLDKAQRHAYGEAVGKAIRALQCTELLRALESTPRTNCASGTLHTTGEAIHAAVLEQQRNKLLAYPGKVRRERTPEQWQSLYNKAMQEKARGQR